MKTKPQHSLKSEFQKIRKKSDTSVTISLSLGTFFEEKFVTSDFVD
jgi:hypothetical protein